MTLLEKDITSIAEKQTIRVLLVDDDREDSLIFSRLISHLQDCPIEFTWTSDYDNARELISSRDYHIHFLDYRLGKHSGLELMERSLRESPAKSFVMVSGIGSERLAAESIRLGAVDYIAKADLSTEEISRCIAHCAKQSQDRTRRIKRMELDALTEVMRREVFEDAAERRLRNDTASDAAWTLLFVDIDHFKDVNDRFSHQHGDDVLRQVADAIRSCMRRGDMVCRYGGDEFCVLSTGADPDAAAAMGERIRETVESRTEVTVSVGVAQQQAKAASLQAMLSHADSMMYQAKKTGRNKVEIWQG